MIYCHVNHIKCRADRKIKQSQQIHGKENTNQDPPLMPEKNGKNKNTCITTLYYTASTGSCPKILKT